MIRNALITSYRTIVNNKTYSVISLAGLVLGLAAAFVLLVYAINEGSYNRCFTNYSQLSRIIITDSKGMKVPQGSALIRPMLSVKMPESVKMARVVHNMYMPDKIKVYGNKIYEVSDFICADPEIFEILNLDLIRGELKSGPKLKNPLYISEKALKEYFNNDIKLCQDIRISIGKFQYDMTLAGVYRELPWNSSINANFIAGFPFYEKILGDAVPELLQVFNSFGDFSVETICEFKEGTDIPGLSGIINTRLDDPSWKQMKEMISFQTFKDIYLESADLQNNCHLKGNKLSVYTYSWLAFFILLLAGINYAILSTARSALRFKEIGIRKVLGATKKELRVQILIESVLLTLMALPMSMFILGLIDPQITGLPDYTITMYASNMPKYIVFFLLITLLIGILSGLYVAVYLAGLNPINALKARYFSPGKFSLSKVFIGFQLFITLSLLICMITLYSQIRLCYISNLSISRDNVLLIPLKRIDFQKYTAFKAGLLKTEGVICCSGTGLFSLPSNSISTNNIRTPNAKDPVPVEWIIVDKGFFNTLGIPVLRGRDFDTASIMRNEIECIFNEEGIRSLGLKKPLGAIVNDAKIVGVVRDFNVHTLHQKINASLFLYNPYAINTVLVHYRQGTEDIVIGNIKALWDKIYPKHPFSYSVFRQELRSVYQKENNFVIAVAVFTILAFIITGMGLFGLALLISERKTKETAIRKVFGASNVQIIYRMQKEFLIYTALATVAAIPVSYVLMELWLKEFYYRVDVSVWVMLLCVLTVTVFVSSILLVRTLKVLRSNPVNALKYE